MELNERKNDRLVSYWKPVKKIEENTVNIPRKKLGIVKKMSVKGNVYNRRWENKREISAPG